MNAIVDEKTELPALSEGYHWLPGWYASRLHAVAVGTELPTRHATIRALCGEHVYGKGPTEWAQRRVDKGVARCKRCEKKVLEAQK